MLHDYLGRFTGGICSPLFRRRLALGQVLARRGLTEEAERLVGRAAELVRRGAGPVERAATLAELASLRAARGDRDGAAELLREAREVLEPCRDPGIAPHAGRARRAQRADRPARPAPGLGAPLTAREHAVLRLLATPLSQRDIGAALYLSLNTVKSHVKGGFRKLGVSTRPEATATCIGDTVKQTREDHGHSCGAAPSASLPPKPSARSWTPTPAPREPRSSGSCPTQP